MIQPRKILKKGGNQENQNQETVTPDTKLRSSQEKQPTVLVESPVNANKASPVVDVTDYKPQTVTNYFKPVDKKSYDKLVIRSSKISTLKTTVSKMEKRHKELTSQIEQLKKENKELRNKLKGIETKTKTNKLTNQAPEKSKQQKSSPITPHGTKKQQSQPSETSKKHVNQERTQNEKQQVKKQQQQQSKQQQQRELKQQQQQHSENQQTKMKRTANSTRKPLVMIAGDSMVKNLKGYLMSSESVFISWCHNT